ncbi:MAG: endolytic transglycosylase MltG [Candidatus Zixiibacteriota bacterium]|nr:MAG: endolytic transglycosylase MltG [candidate division Zixibacteria bacterium]
MRTKFVLKLVAVVVVAVVVYGAYLYYRTVDLGDRVATIVIKPGDTLTGIARRLLDEGVVQSRLMLVYPGRLMNIDTKLVPGRYDFTGKNSCRSVLARLKAADFVRIKVTVPEGATLWKVASIMADKLQLDSAGFLGLCQDLTFLDSLDLPTLEGYLFPETYFFPWGISDTAVVAGMLQMYHSQTDSIWPEVMPDGFGRHDIIKLASIIEAETGQIDERTLVSSVYHNRLRRNMRLDADPTVIYGLGGLDRPLYRKDLTRDTPYNTYLHRGLPPTPINSPGLASIVAALQPEETEFLYFVAGDSGRHVFSKTNAEHNRAKQQIDNLRKKK